MNAKERIPVDGRKPLIRECEFRPSTNIHRLAHRGREDSAQPAEFGRLPNSGFRENVNRPTGHGGAEIPTSAMSYGDFERTGPAL